MSKYILLTIAEYIELNYVISSLEGFDIAAPTQRMFPMNPRAAKTDIATDEEGNELSYTPKVVARIYPTMIDNYPEIFAAYDLVNNYISTGEEIYQFVIDVISLNAINWAAIQFSTVKGIGKEITLVVSQELINSLPQEMIDELGKLDLKLEVSNGI